MPNREMEYHSWTLPSRPHSSSQNSRQQTSVAGDDQLFLSLGPVNGLLSGAQVRPVLERSGLPSQQLGQIWNQVDLNHDGYINKQEFMTAMGLVRQASTSSLKIPLSSSSSNQSQGWGSTPVQSLHSPLLSPTYGGTSPTGKGTTSYFGGGTPPFTGVTTGGSTSMIGGVGRAVSMGSLTPSWTIPPDARSRYNLMFNTNDKSRSGFLSGDEARKILMKFNIDRDTQKKIWDLSDIDKDGRLSTEEFAIAMFLIEKSLKGIQPPLTLPSELQPKKEAPNSPLSNFEDKRKENFEQGRAELERRRRLLQEREEKVKKEKERKMREEEERRRQEEIKANAARQAELEKQRRKAMEIEKERERVMQMAALQREAEAREAERKRKEEWMKRRYAELEIERNREKEALEILKHTNQELNDLLTKIELEKRTTKVRVDQQRTRCAELAANLDSYKRAKESQKPRLLNTASLLKESQQELTRFEYQRRQYQQRLSVQMSGEEAEEHVKLTECCHNLSGNVNDMKRNFSEQTNQCEQLKISTREKKSKLSNLQAEIRNLSRIVQQLKNRKELAEREAEKEKMKKEEVDRRKKALEDAQRRQREIQAIIRQQKEEEERIKKQKEDEDRMKEEEMKNVVANELVRLKSQKEVTAKKKPPVHPIRPRSGGVDKGEEELKSKLAELQERRKQLEEKRNTQTKPSYVNDLAGINFDTGQRKTPSTCTPLYESPDAFIPSKVSKPTPNKQSTPTHKPPLPPKPSNLKRTAKPNTTITSLQSHPQNKDTPLLVSNKTVEERIYDLPDNIRGVPKGTQNNREHDEPQLGIEPVMYDQTPVERKVENVVYDQTPVERKVEPVIYDQTPVERKVEPVIYDQTPVERKVEPVIYDQTPVERKFENVLYHQTPVEGRVEEVIYDTVPRVDRIEEAQEREEVPLSPLPVISYRAQFPFTATNEQEISFTRGDILRDAGKDVSAQDGWVKVEKDDKRGWAPIDYLQPITTKAMDSSECYVKVLYSWNGTKPNHLSIIKGQLVLVTQKGEGWWMGTTDDKVGWFPRKFVEELPEVNDEESPLPVTSQEISEQYKAIYGYAGEHEGDLSFPEGSIIKVSKKDGNWWIGEFNGTVGVFPSNYVSPLAMETNQVELDLLNVPQDFTPRGTRKNPQIARVIVGFSAIQDGQISLTPGQLVLVKKREDNGWCVGELQIRGEQRKTGWFPSNRIEMMTSSNTLTSPKSSTPVSSGPNSASSSPPTGSLVLALYSYQASSGDELSFHKGSVITVLSKEESDWWKGEMNGQVGLFPSNYVQALDTLKSSSEATNWSDHIKPDIIDKIPLKERKRQEAIFELVHSEKNYVYSLNLVKEIFFVPLENANILSEMERNQVIVNWEEVLECNSAFCNALFIRLRTSGAIVHIIGDLLQDYIPQLIPHVRWCSCQLNACTLLQSKSTDQQFKEFEQNCMKDQRTKGLPLSSFLLKPMQRVTKYPLLIQKILEYTSPSEPDYELLLSSMHQAETLCSQVNEAVRQKENSEKLEWLQTHIHLTLNEKLVFNSSTNFMGSRRLLHSGKVTKVRGNKEMLGFLFNDFFLLVRPKSLFATATQIEPFSDNHFTMYREPFLLNQIQAKQAPVEQYGPSTFVVSVTKDKERKEIPLKVESDVARNQWVKLIMEACVNYVKTKRKANKLERSDSRRVTIQKNAIGKLMVTVVEAADLIASSNGKSDPFCVVHVGENQEGATPVIQNTLHPQWNYLMEFFVSNVDDTMVEINVFDSDLFSPNDFLGCAKLSLKELREEGPGPWKKRLLLEDVAKGELELKIAYRQMQLPVR